MTLRELGLSDSDLTLDDGDRVSRRRLVDLRTDVEPIDLRECGVEDMRRGSSSASGDDPDWKGLS